VGTGKAWSICSRGPEWTNGDTDLRLMRRSLSTYLRRYVGSASKG